MSDLLHEKMASVSIILEMSYSVVGRGEGNLTFNFEELDIKIECLQIQERIQFTAIGLNTLQGVKLFQDLCITIRIDKQPEQIAKELDKRLIQYYKEQVTLHKERLKRINGVIIETRETQERFKEILGGTITQAYDGRAFKPAKRENGTFKDFYVADGMVNFELRYVPTDVAERIFRILAEKGE